MATTVQVVIDCADPAAQSDFWREALHHVAPDPDDDPEGNEFCVQ